jgi:hypothetical protein
MIRARREITFLPKKDQTIVQTTEFEEMKKLLVVQVVKSNEQLDKKRPTLLVGGEEGCEAPKKLYKDTDLIESICAQFEPTTRASNQ